MAGLNLPWGSKSIDDTLRETNMETQKGPYKDYGPFKKVLYGFPCWFGECTYLGF